MALPSFICPPRRLTHLGKIDRPFKLASRVNISHPSPSLLRHQPIFSGPIGGSQASQPAPKGQHYWLNRRRRRRGRCNATPQKDPKSPPQRPTKESRV